ncbi:Conserved hypothetical protein [Shewanella piezotolerans WP3]|uniref:Uncharacterized protein n=2 Tax=Shewanella TaxID=22 RepID=B8CQD1_SHEPW|nr:Conserved hypothetical protein [Shewanella piezotolerans WP3]
MIYLPPHWKIRHLNSQLIVYSMSYQSVSTAVVNSIPLSGSVPVEVNLAGDSHDVALWIWEQLVPQVGSATTLQGEIIRAIELLSWEAQNNSNLNWDNSFDALIAFLKEAFLGQSMLARWLSDTDKKQIAADLARLSCFILPTELDSRVYVEELPYINDDLYDRLTDYLVQFCRQHPAVIFF